MTIDHSVVSSWSIFEKNSHSTPKKPFVGITGVLCTILCAFQEGSPLIPGLICPSIENPWHSPHKTSLFSMFSSLRNWFPWGGGGFASLLPRVFSPSHQAALVIDLKQSCLNILCFSLRFQEVTAFPGKGMYWQYWGRLDAEFSAAATKAISVKMDVELLAREVKSGRPPSLHHSQDEKCQSWEAERGPPAMADGDGLDRKIGKYAEYFSVMGAAWPKVPRDLGRVPCNQLSIWSRSPC